MNISNASVSFPQCNELSELEWHYVYTYAGNLYESLNLFLINTDTLHTYRCIYPQEFAQNLYYLITNQPDLYVNGTISTNEEDRVVTIIKSNYGNLDWFRYIMFRFTITLYRIILKCPKQHQQVIVHRGVLSHYLKEDKTNGHFLATFTSTSTNTQIARGFSKNNNREVVIYHFYIMPGVSCIFIGKGESELLINPYQCYNFIKKEDNHYFYTIYPISITPPDNEGEFLEFKRTISAHTVAMDGGSDKNIQLRHKGIMLNNRATYNSINIKTHTNTTKKNKKQKKMSELDHFRARMRLPIGTTTFGITLTPEMIENNARIEKEINQHIKDGYYKNWGL